MGPWPKGLDEVIDKERLSIRHTTLKPLEEFLKDKDYGPGLVDLGLIHMIFRPDIKLYNERMKYDAKKGDADYRLKINYDDFVHADESGKRSLLIKNLLSAIRMIGEKTKHDKAVFDSEQMEYDIREFLNFCEEI